MSFAHSGHHRIAFDDRGPRSERALVLLPGWCVNRSFFDALATRLAARHRVLTLDWRGHGDSSSVEGGFEHSELADDARAVIDTAGVRQVIPIAQAHGGWVAVELVRRMATRVEAIVAMSWLVLEPPPPFAAILEALGDPARWESARDRLFEGWVTGAPSAVGERVRKDMGAYGLEMWSRAGRAIASDYARFGSPLRALAAERASPPLLHLYSQPRAPEFLDAQRAFARDHAWFSVQRLDAVSHFPALEIPDDTCAMIERFVGEHATR